MAAGVADFGNPASGQEIQAFGRAGDDAHDQGAGQVALDAGVGDGGQLR